MRMAVDHITDIFTNMPKFPRGSHQEVVLAKIGFGLDGQFP